MKNKHLKRRNRSLSIELADLAVSFEEKNAATVSAAVTPLNFMLSPKIACSF